MTALLVASGIGVVGVAPALAAPAPTDFHTSDQVHQWAHDHLFHARKDVRYVWFRVCDTTATVPAPAVAAGATTTTDAAVPGTTTTDAVVPGTTTDPASGTTTTDPVAPDALTAAVEGAALDTATDPPTATDTPTTVDTATTEPTTATTTADDTDAGAVSAYPTFVVVPMPRGEANAMRKLDDRPCFDLTTGAPATTDTTDTSTTDTTTETTTETTTTGTTTTGTTTTETPAPVDTTTTG